MAKSRSPGYPAIGLKEAISKVEAVYGRDYQNRIPRKVAAEHMGYASLNGKSLGVLSALLKYGLLEGRGDETRVSDDAVTIIAHPPGSPERGDAIALAADRPELFAEISKRFPSGKASDQAIRSYLLTQKFIPAAADSAIRAYRETKELVDAETAGYRHLDEEAERETEAEQQMQALRQETGEQSAKAGRVPMRVTFNGDQLEVAACLADAKSVDRLVQVLEANKILLRTKEVEENPSE